MNVIALDLGTLTGWAFSIDGHVTSGTKSFKQDRFSGGGMRYLLFRKWLAEMHSINEIHAVYFESVRRHVGVDAAHAYGGFMATLTAWCESYGIPYEGIPVGTIKKSISGRGNASKQEVIDAVIARGYHPAGFDEADALALLLLKKDAHE